MALIFAGFSPDQPRIHQPTVLSWQRFLTVSPWEAQNVQQEFQAVFNEEFVPSASRWSIGTVGVIDESSFVKRGTESVGVQRQWCGRPGKEENCQVGVFLLGVTPAGSVLSDHQLYLPESWAGDRRGGRRRVFRRRSRSKRNPRSPRHCWPAVPCISIGSLPMRPMDEWHVL